VSPENAKPGRRFDVTRDDLKLLALVLIAIGIWLIFLFGQNVAG